VKNSVIQNPFEYGGMKMINVKHFFKAQQINWIKLIFKNKDTLPSELIKKHLKMSLDDTLKSNIHCEKLPFALPVFYASLLKSWFSFKKEPTNPDDVKREIIWFNQYILIDEKYVFIKPLYDNGMVFIADIIDNENNFLNDDRILNAFGNCLTPIRYTCLIHGIPRSWRRILKKKKEYLIFCLNWKLCLSH
jgi:hypothetical protein